ncbi:hypothetical protein G647_09282 [Cladophialophora carrionii CBS 160.54]|uniref:Uncharacterized protein n=1 Tax=Cladophialophora carrionii CBS 160.54 TaxID=1279043 RepID=V9CZK7_9EURO|nr:uncharacterized protein G647_09282 [Cladophialophora carrionii CBS 160.54]ETI19448.1 hypothetical protein G647_09282 [Cladophialophora carrionii CBS 160.54]
MSDENKENRISMEDNSENIPPEDTKGKQEAQGDSGSWYTKPEEKGNSIGGKIQGALSPVGNVAGPALEKGAAPVGALLGSSVGGIMKGGQAWGEQLGVGYGNAEGGPAKAQEAEYQRMKEDLGGKEQTGDNPLGL